MPQPQQLARKPRYEIEQVRIDDMKGVEMWQLDRFAAEFGHRIEPVFPIFLVFVDGELSAYYYAHPQVVIYPAVHPSKFNPRSFYSVAKTIISAAKQVFGNPLWVVTEDSQLANPALLRKIRLNLMPVRVYETDE